jgi:serine/threonine-protein kinase
LTLPEGRRLGPYEVVGPLGAGGMGEVYRAHDARLGRDVALKILPAAVAQEPDRLARFEREARALASLNHPNIAQIYGIEESGDIRALVMELVPGEDLEQIIARGPMPLDRTLAIAGQIADALEAAHEAGIVHRDLKPANVKVRPDGTVKVLDFGLAKAAASDPAVSSGASRVSEDSPTLVSPAVTQMGVILGTATYMSPEQARGGAVDRRTDIWAFGAVLYEMLTGERLFAGATVSDVIAAILRQDIDLSRLPAVTPPSVRQLLTRCLDRDVKARLQAIGEARLVLAGVPRGSAPTGTASFPGAEISALRSRGRGKPVIAAIAVLGVVLVLAAAALLFVPWALRRGKASPGEGHAAARGDRSIAVLPFVNSSGSPADEYLADGMTDELIAALGKVPSLRVAARSSAFTFKGRKVEAREVAQQLGVETVLEGTVRRSGQRLRVTASLVSAADGLQIWSSNFESDGADPFAVQDQVTRGVVDGLALQLAGTALQASQAGRTKDPEAHDLYLRGLAASNPASEADLMRAIDLFQQALKRDPDFALPYSGIAWAEIFLADAYVPPNEAYPKALAAARAAIERDPLLADPHAILGYSLMATDWSFPPEIEREFNRARELDPNSAITLETFAMFLSTVGRTDEGLALAARAEHLDPLSPVAPFVMEWSNFVAGRWQATLDAHRRTMTIDPTFIYIESWAGGAYREMGDLQASLKEYEAGEKLLGGAPQCGLALTYLKMGREKDARDTMKRLDDYAAVHYLSPALRSVVHGALGDTEGGVALLEEAGRIKDLYLIIAASQGELEPLKRDRRARAIIEQIEAKRH